MLHIAFGADTNYIMQCGVAITSLCENNTDMDMSIHVLALCDVNDIPLYNVIKDIANKYGKSLEIIRVDDKNFEGMPEQTYISRATYLRLLLPSLICQNVTQILYIDSDITVLGSLKYFEKNTLNESEAAAAVIDLNGNSINHHNSIDIPVNANYFNAGVLLINLDYWRKNDISRTAMSNIIKCQYSFQDQDAINALLYNKIRTLPFKYNLQVNFLELSESEYGLDKKYYEDIKQSIANPIILHYSSYRKPWHKKCPHAEYWLKYKMLTPWAEVPLEESKMNPDELRELKKKAVYFNPYGYNKSIDKFYKLLILNSTSSLRGKSTIVSTVLWLMNKAVIILQKFEIK